MRDSRINTAHRNGFYFNFVAMARKLPLLTYLLFYAALNTYSQDQAYTVPNSEFLRFIRDSRFDGSKFFTFPDPNTKKILDLRNTRVGNNGQCLLIANGEIFIHIPSTDIICKFTGPKQGFMNLR